MIPVLESALCAASLCVKVLSRMGVPDGKRDANSMFGRRLHQKKITAAQIKKLVETGKTNEIKGFTSKKGKKFDARLKLNTDKTGVEFEFVNHRSKCQS